MTQSFIEGRDISYADMERQGFDPSFIDDYQALKRELRPLVGNVTPPNTSIQSNLSGFYIYSDSPNPVELWFNPTAGVDTGWIQLV